MQRMKKDLEMLNIRTINDLVRGSEHRETPSSRPCDGASMQRLDCSMYGALVQLPLFLTDLLSHSAAARLIVLFNGFTSTTSQTFKAMVAS